MYVLQVFSPASVIFAGIGVFLSVSIMSIISFGGSFSPCTSERPHKALRRVKTCSQSFSDASDTPLRD